MEPSRLPPLMQPFRGLRYADGAGLGRLVAPPYDVIGPERRAELAGQDDRNVVHLTLPEGADDRYQRAADLLAAWRDEGVLEEDPGPTVTVMRQRFELPDGDEVERTGVFVAVAAEPYATGRVRPHERTHRGPKEDRLNLLRATQTLTEPIFLLSPDPDGDLVDLTERVCGREPDAVLSLDEVGIDLWVESGPEVEEALEAAGAAPLYIADGHHRYETTVAWAAERDQPTRILAFVVSTWDPGLTVLPTHRMVKGAPVDQEALLKTIAPHFALETADGAECTVVWPQRVETHLGCLEPAREMLDGSENHEAVAELTITRVERFLIQPLLVAAGPDSELSYTPDETLARIRVAEGTASAAVIVEPTPVEAVLRVADAGGIMPPKSTYFFPKVPSGIVLMPGTR